MGFFSRRPPTSENTGSSPGGPADLTTLVLAVLAEQGIAGTVQEPLLIVDSQGRLFALHNLAEQVSGLPQAQWRAHAERFVRVVSEGMAPQPQRSLAALGNSLLLRIVHPDLGHSESNAQVATHGHHLAADLVVLPAIDHPERVEILTNTRALGGWDAIWPVGIANLKGLPTPHHEIVGDPGEGDQLVHLFISEDFFGASRLLVLEDVFARASKQPFDAPHGTLVVVPNRHVLGVHVLSGAGLVAAVSELTRIAAREVPGYGAPLSTDVYYRSTDGALQQVSSRDPQGRSVMKVEGALMKAMEDLDLLN